MATEYLKGPSNQYGARAGSVIERMPVLYSPSSSAEVNEARLPFPEEYRDMELSYREQFFTDRGLNLLAWANILQILMGSWGLSLAAVITSHFVPNTMGVYFAGIVSCLLIYWAIRNNRITKPFDMMNFAFGPLLVYFILSLLGFLMSVRLLATIVFAVATLVIYLLIGFRPFAFHRDWAYTHPRLKPETRRQPRKIRVTPNLLLLTTILLITIVVPAYSPTAAIGSVIALSLFSIRKELQPWAYLKEVGRFVLHMPEMIWYGAAAFGYFRQGTIRRNEMPEPEQGIPTPRTSPAARFFAEPFGLTNFITRVKAVFGLFFTYGLSGAALPGVWFPHPPARTRRIQGWLLVGPLFFTLSVGLNLFCPWDVFHSYIRAEYGSEATQMLPLTPYNWIYLALNSDTRERYLFIWMIPLAAVVSLFTLPLVLAAIFRPALRAAEQLRREIDGTPERPGLDDDGRTEWQWYVDRLRQSKHQTTGPFDETIREADHLFLGVEPRAQIPVLLHNKALSEHCYICGDTGSGKTALGIMPMLIQLIRGSAGPNSDGMGPPPPIVILDLKGDNALFQTVRHEMEERRRQAGITDPNDPRFAFRFFTPEKGKASCLFNPFQNLRSDSRTDIQLCHLFLDALNLNHGEGYGRSYYSRKNRLMLYEALTEEPRPDSIEALFERLKRMVANRGDNHAGPGRGREIGSTDYRQDTFELLSTIHALAQYPMLATARPGEDAIQSIFMPELIEHRQVAYFWLPSVMESISVREIGKLAVYALLTAAIDRQRSPQASTNGQESEPRQVYLVIDEFQRLAGENFKVVLEQARSFGISAILANQIQADLITHDIDLTPTIRSNTRTKMFFALSDADDCRQMSEASGEEVAIARSFTHMATAQGLATGVSVSQALKPRLTLNDVLSVTDHPLEFILQVSRGSGYTQFAGMPMVIRTTYPLSKETYEARSRAPWPEGKVYTVTPKKSPKEIDADAAAKAQEELSSLIAEFKL